MTYKLVQLGLWIIHFDVTISKAPKARAHSNQVSLWMNLEVIIDASVGFKSFSDF